MQDVDKMLNLSRKLKQARVEAGFSQKELGQALGLTDKAVSSYEVGRSMPNIDVLEEIAKLTNKSVNYFLEEDSGKNVTLEQRVAKLERELAEIRKQLG